MSEKPVPPSAVSGNGRGVSVIITGPYSRSQVIITGPVERLITVTGPYKSAD